MDDTIRRQEAFDALNFCTSKASRAPNGSTFPEKEPFIAQDAKASYLYAVNVSKARFELGETEIKKHPHWASQYAKHVVKGRWIEAEQFIILDDNEWRDYSNFVLDLPPPEKPKGFFKKLFNL